MAKAESDLRSILDGGFDPHKFAWYEPELIEVPEPAKSLLEKYSKIPPGHEVEHVKKVVSPFHSMARVPTLMTNESERSSIRCGKLDISSRQYVLQAWPVWFSSDAIVFTIPSLAEDTDNYPQFPYPCIGSFRFLDLSIPQSPLYPEILDRLKSGQKLLDVGCAVGQELRQLVRPQTAHAGSRAMNAT